MRGVCLGPFPRTDSQDPLTPPRVCRQGRPAESSFFVGTAFADPAAGVWVGAKDELFDGMCAFSCDPGMYFRPGLNRCERCLACGMGQYPTDPEQQGCTEAAPRVACTTCSRDRVPAGAVFVSRHDPTCPWELPRTQQTAYADEILPERPVHGNLPAYIARPSGLSNTAQVVAASVYHAPDPQHSKVCPSQPLCLISGGLLTPDRTTPQESQPVHPSDLREANPAAAPGKSLAARDRPRTGIFLVAAAAVAVAGGVRVSGG